MEIAGLEALVLTKFANIMSLVSNFERNEVINYLGRFLPL